MANKYIIGDYEIDYGPENVFDEAATDKEFAAINKEIADDAACRLIKRERETERLANFPLKLGKLAIVLALLCFAPAAWGQMSHAVIYAPSKTVDVKPDPTATAVQVVVPDIKCDLKYKWIINTYKTAQVWYVYVTPEELKCLIEAGDIKYWAGATAKEAWMAAYKSGLPDAVALFEQNAKYPVDVIDSETGKNVTKMVPVTEAKLLGVKIEQSVIDKQGDAMLPRKIFDGSK